jgi:4-amino-4-deoxy-L-arabinose transferase-like glycosyltransferase
MERLTTSERIFAVLLVLSIPVYFLSLGANSIWDANEAFYVDAPRHMVETGDYITPFFNGVERLNKPVLSYWLVAGLYRLLGVSVTTERVGIALGALGIIVAAFVIGRALRSTLVGVLSALIITTAPRVVMWSRRIAIDTYIAMFMSLALACFVLAERHPRQRTRYLLAMYVMVGLGVLTKGPVAIVLPAAACLIWLLTEGRVRDVFRLRVPAGIAIVLAIVVPWYAALVVRHGWAPVTSFVVGENLDRFTTSMQPDRRPIWFYLPVLLTDLFPWAPLCLVPLVSVWWPRSSDAGGAPAVAGGLRRLLWIWIAVIAGAFSLSQTKQDLYIYPVIVAVAALVADAIVATDWTGRHRGLRALLGVVAAASAAAGVVMWRLFGAGYYALGGTPVVAVLLVAGGLAVLGLTVAGRGRAAVATLALTFVAFNYVFVTRVLPAVERLKPVVPLAQEFLRRASPTDRLGSYEMMLPSLVYYAGRPVESLEGPDQARAFYADARGGWALMDQGRFDLLRADVPGVCVAARHPRLDPRFEDVWAGRPPADVLLVTNRCGAPTN